jgi:hypothetical protein
LIGSLPAAWVNDARPQPSSDLTIWAKRVALKKAAGPNTRGNTVSGHRIQRRPLDFTVIVSQNILSPAQPSAS